MKNIKLLLRDIAPRLVDAWREFFRDYDTVELSEGNIFDLKADAIVSPANSFGYMDGGIDLVYSREFGWDLQHRLQDLLAREHDGELPVGQAVVIETKSRDIPWLVSAPTMRAPEDVSGTVNAYLAFRAALRAIKAHNATAASPISSVLCPGLGTAIGRLPFRTCAKQMLLAYRVVTLGNKEVHTSIGDILTNHRAMKSSEN